MPCLVIMRGLPGSGKSHYIRENWPEATPAAFAPTGWSTVVVSSDHFFTNFTTGEYNFDISKLGEAHTKAQILGIRSMQDGHETVIIDNTHSRHWEFALWLELADVFDYRVKIVTVDAKLTPEELAARNIHGAPAEVIAKMQQRWEP